MQNNNEQEQPLGPEFEGTSVEDAIDIAVIALNVPKEKIRITILTEGHKGLFGQPGAKKAKIHATILPEGSD